MQLQPIPLESGIHPNRGYFDKKVFEFYSIAPPSLIPSNLKRADSSYTDHYLWANCIRTLIQKRLVIPFPLNNGIRKWLRSPKEQKSLSIRYSKHLSRLNQIKFSHASLLYPLFIALSLCLVYGLTPGKNPRWRSIGLIPLAKCQTKWLIAFFQSPYSVHLSLRRNWKRQLPLVPTKKAERG